MKDRLLALLRIALGVLFVYSSLTKLPDMALFAESVSNYRLLPAMLIPFFASALVGTEFVAGLALVFGLGARAAAGWTAVMLVGFIVALSQALVRGIDLGCGCFGSTDAEQVSWGTVGRDVLMLAAALAVVRWGSGRLLPRRAVSGSPDLLVAPHPTRE